MHVDVVIKRLSVNGLTVRSREAWMRALRSAIAEQLEASLNVSGTPASLRQALHIKHVSAPALRVSAGTGLDTRIAHGAAQCFCASLSNTAGLQAEPARTLPTSLASTTHNGLEE